VVRHVECVASRMGLGRMLCLALQCVEQLSENVFDSKAILLVPLECQKMHHELIYVRSPGYIDVSIPNHPKPLATPKRHPTRTIQNISSIPLSSKTLLPRPITEVPVVPLALFSLNVSSKSPVLSS
jgi:hypothetical protein